MLHRYFITFSVIFFLSFLKFTFNACSDENNTKTPRGEERSDGDSDNWLAVLKTYIFPDKNPIFQDQQHEISVSYLVSDNAPKGYEAAHIQPGGMFRRAVHSFQMHYQQPDKLLGIHGRLSAGFFTLHGVANYYKHTYQAYGIELIQELIFGTPMLYITAGIGPSYMTGKTGRTGESMVGLTAFNFSSVIKVGHRFRCGAILELHYHHYSNGGLGLVNQGLDMIGMSFGWVF